MPDDTTKPTVYTETRHVIENGRLEGGRARLSPDPSAYGRDAAMINWAPPVVENLDARVRPHHLVDVLMDRVRVERAFAGDGFPRSFHLGLALQRLKDARDYLLKSEVSVPQPTEPREPAAPDETKAPTSD